MAPFCDMTLMTGSFGLSPNHLHLAISSKTCCLLPQYLRKIKSLPFVRFALGVAKGLEICGSKKTQMNGMI